MKRKTNISDKALQLINQQKIKPIPKWEFVVKNWGLWLGLVVSLGFLTLGTGVVWFGLVDNIITPYPWLSISMVFLAISFLLFEKTKGAYRWSRWQVIVIIGVVGLVIGGILFRVGLASKVDRNFETSIPYYRQMVPIKLETWSRPELGYLSGTITKVVGDSNFEIQDFGGKTWNINSQEALIRGRVELEKGQEIKLIGEKMGDSKFMAKEIRPWVGRRN